MKSTFDTDSIIYGVINGNETIKSSISGLVCIGERPLNSEKEDIVINTITLTQEFSPQIGTSNINIHVSDIDVTIGGAQQKMPNTDRLRAITGYVMDAVRSARINGLKMTIESQTTINESQIKQHYSNIRVSWNIQTN